MKKPAKVASSKPKEKIPSERAVSQGRHEARCSICAHLKREEIEQSFVAWVSPVKIAEEHCVS
jgi:hypothetical protein